MFRVVFTALVLVWLLCHSTTGCTRSQDEEYNPDRAIANRFKGNTFFKPYFYPIKSVPVIYIYRDVVNGLLEQFHRVYTLTDTEGEHLIVERYNMKGNLYEAFNFNTDSLNLMDHMIVNQNQENTKTTLFKDGFFPANATQTPICRSQWKWNDTTTVFREIKRTLMQAQTFSEVLGKKTRCMQFADDIMYQYVNAITKERKTWADKQKTLYAEGLGLVEWEGTNNKVHFKLERIISQEEWINMFKR